MQVLAVLLMAGVLDEPAAIPRKGKAETLPGFYYLPSQTENSAVTLDECEGDPPYLHLVCHFTQVGVSRKSREDVAKDRQQTSAIPDAEAAKELASIQKNCPMQKAIGYAGLSPEKRAAVDQVSSLFGAVCGCREVSCLRATMGKVIDDEADTCKVWTYHFTLEFDRVIGERKWISNPGPQGLCNMVTAVVIEEDRDHPFLWTYTQKRITVDRSGEFCKNLDPEQTMVNSWNTPSSILMNCKKIEFGR
jgi:hypothetical protein